MKKRRFITLLLSLCLCITSLPCPVFADEIEQITETAHENESNSDLASEPESESEQEQSSEPEESQPQEPEPESESEGASQEPDPDSLPEEKSEQLNTNEESATAPAEEGASDEMNDAIEYITLTFMTVDEEVIDEIVIEKGGAWQFPDASEFLPEPGADFAWYDEELEEEIVENTSFETDMLIILFYRGDATILIEPCEDGAHDFVYAPADAQDGQNYHRVTCSICDYSAIDACRVDDISVELVDESTNLVHFHKICNLCRQEEIATNETCSAIYEDNGDGTHDVICYHCNTTYTAPHMFVDGRCVVCENVKSDYRYYNTVTYLENYQTYEENSKYMQALSDYENSLVTLGDKQYLYALLSESPDIDNAVSDRRYYAPLVTFAKGYNAAGTYQSNLKFDEVYDDLGHKLIEKATFTEDTFNTEVDILHLEKQVFPYLIENKLVFSNGSAYWNLFYFDDTVWAPVASAAQIVDYGCPRSYDFSFDVSNGLRVKHNGTYEDFYDYTYSTYRIMYPKMQNHNNVIFDYSTFVRDFVVTDYIYDGEFHTCITLPSDVNYAQYAWIESDDEFEQIKEQIKNTGTFETENYYWDYLPKRKWIGKYNYVLKFKLSGMSDTFYLPFTFEIKEQGCTHDYITEYMPSGIDENWAYLSNWSSYSQPVKLERCTKCQNVRAFWHAFRMSGLSSAIKNNQTNFGTKGYSSITINGYDMMNTGDAGTTTSTTGSTIELKDIYWAKENEKIYLSAVPIFEPRGWRYFYNASSSYSKGDYFTKVQWRKWDNVLLYDRMVHPFYFAVNTLGSNVVTQYQIDIKPTSFIRFRAQNLYSYGGVNFPAFAATSIATSFKDRLCEFGERNPTIVTSGAIYHALIDEQIYEQAAAPDFDFSSLELNWSADEPMITQAGPFFVVLKTTTSLNETIYMPLRIDVAEESAWLNDYTFTTLQYLSSEDRWQSSTWYKNEYGQWIKNYSSNYLSFSENALLDKTKKYVILRQYIGTETDLVVPDRAIIGGEEYIVSIGSPDGKIQNGSFYIGTGGTSGIFENSSVEHVKFERDVFVGYGLYNTFAYSHVKSVDLSEVDLSNVIGLSNVFRNTDALETVDFGDQALPNLQCVYMLFYKSAIEEIRGLRVAPNLINTYYTFSNCKRLKEIDLSGWTICDTSNTSVRNMFENCGIRKLIAPNFCNSKPCFSNNGLPFYVDRENHLEPGGDFIDDLYENRYMQYTTISQSAKTYIAPTELVVREYKTDRVIAVQYGYETYKSDWYFEADGQIQKRSQEDAIAYFNEHYVLYTTNNVIFDFDSPIPDFYCFSEYNRAVRNEVTVYALPKQITIKPELFVTYTEYIHEEEISADDIFTIFTKEYEEEFSSIGVSLVVEIDGDRQSVSILYDRVEKRFSLFGTEYTKEDLLSMIEHNILFIENIGFMYVTEDTYKIQMISLPEDDSSAVMLSDDDLLFFYMTYVEDANGNSSYSEDIVQSSELAHFMLPEAIFSKDVWEPETKDHYGIDEISTAVTDDKHANLLQYELNPTTGMSATYETITLTDEVKWANSNRETIAGEVMFDHSCTIFPYLHTDRDEPTCDADGTDYYETDVGVEVTRSSEYSFSSMRRIVFQLDEYIRNNYMKLPILSNGSYLHLCERDREYAYSGEDCIIKKNGSEYTVIFNNVATTYTDEEVQAGVLVQLPFSNYFNVVQITTDSSNTNENALEELKAVEFYNQSGDRISSSVIFSGLFSRSLVGASVVAMIYDRESFKSQFTEYIYANGRTYDLKLLPSVQLEVFSKSDGSLAVYFRSNNRRITFASPEACADYLVDHPQVTSVYGSIEIPEFFLSNANFYERYISQGYDYVTIPATGHAYDAGITTLAPTCTEDGVKTFTCQNDDTHTYTEPIPAIGHDWEDEGVVIREATRNEDGIIEYTCKNDPSHKKQETFVFVPVPEYTISVPALIDYASVDDAELDEEMLAFFEGAAGMIYFDFAVTGTDFKDTTVLHVSVNEPELSVKNDYNEETKLHLLNYYNLYQGEEPQSIFDLCANEEDMAAGLGDIYFCTRNTIFELPEEKTYAEVKPISPYESNNTFVYVVGADSAGEFSGGITLHYQMYEVE